MWVTSWETERDGRYVDRKAREMTDYIRGRGRYSSVPIVRPSVHVKQVESS
jgi:hypothetical protein